MAELSPSSPALSSQEAKAIGMRMPDALIRPQFSNLVHSAVLSLEDDSPLFTLSFIFVYGLPTAPDNAELQGEIVARITLSKETAEKLRNALDGQLKGSQPKKQPTPALAAKRSTKRRK